MGRMTNCVSYSFSLVVVKASGFGICYMFNRRVESLSFVSQFVGLRSKPWTGCVRSILCAIILLGVLLSTDTHVSISSALLVTCANGVLAFLEFIHGEIILLNYFFLCSYWLTWCHWLYTYDIRGGRLVVIFPNSLAGYTCYLCGNLSNTTTLHAWGIRCPLVVM